jgi:hypothetical protein
MSIFMLEAKSVRVQQLDTGQHVHVTGLVGTALISGSVVIDECLLNREMLMWTSFLLFNADRFGVKHGSIS